MYLPDCFAYVTVPRVPTYASATGTNNGGHYVDNTDPVIVLDEEDRD